ILPTLEDVYASSDLIVKVKEPQPRELPLLRDHHTLFTYLHLAPDPDQAEALLNSGCTAIAYETVTDAAGGLPLLAPMSEVAGRMSIQVGAWCLEKHQGGSGVLLGGVPGVSPAHVTIIGGGVVGINAAKLAIGVGAQVSIVDRDLKRLRELDLHFNNTIKTYFSTTDTIEKLVHESDLVIGSVLIPGKSAPKLVTRSMLSGMRKGSVIVDVAIDQGGCFETSRPTTHDDPIYTVDGIIHYCVANIPGAVARTSTFALNNATFPYVLALAQKGTIAALKDNPHLLNGLNVYKGKITHSGVAKALDKEYVPFTA
ncbi:MAG: alanine dehydrogenase, partial [Alphaproteobacteria bacterium]|nr:alanine dehydrogenase [Alphaproteobacteria bacterium]